MTKLWQSTTFFKREKKNKSMQVSKKLTEQTRRGEENSVAIKRVTVKKKIKWQ